ncbi:MAG TPA: hypothetical protein VIS96_03525 [Terrimicrobiaceae bacterium]
MNKKLQEAEKNLLEFVDQTPGGVTMEEILARFGDTIGEAELRAAVWTLRAEGLVDFDGNKLRATTIVA